MNLTLLLISIIIIIFSYFIYFLLQKKTQEIQEEETVINEINGFTFENKNSFEEFRPKKRILTKLL